MGATHGSVYRLLPNAMVGAVVDSRGEAVRASLRSCGLEEVPVFTDFATAAAQGDFSVADICLPTDLHRSTALQAFESGMHVFCEKPIALTMEDARAMTAGAREAGRQLMVGHCIRFWPEYVELKRIIDSGEQGRLLSLSMGRHAGRPGYSIGDWVNQPERCLGAALDLHIHDTDFLVHLLGLPHSVTSRGIRDKTGWSSITTQYGYGETVVTAEGAWNYPERWGFQMRFSALFEHAALDFDSRAQPSLTLTIGSMPPVPVDLPQIECLSVETGGNITLLGGYYQELAYFVDYLERGVPVAMSTGEHATESLRVVLAEIESAATGKLLNP